MEPRSRRELDELNFLQPADKLRCHHRFFR